MKVSTSVRHFFMICSGLWVSHVAAAGQAIDCGKPPAGRMEVLVCQDAELVALDREMATAYAAALTKAVNEHPPLLKAEQRGWIKGRNDCWKADDTRACVVDAYRRRMVELQARYRLVPASSPVRYVCNGNQADEVIATCFQTDPPTLLAERGDQTSRMFVQSSASGARYGGRNESLWEHQGEVAVVWGYGAPEMRCRKPRNAAVSRLVGSAWQLVAIQSMDDAQGTLRIANPDRFTLNFESEGRARFRIDCNRGSAIWLTAASSESSSRSIEFGPLVLTRMACPPDSPDRRVLRDLPYVRSYLLKDGKLHLSLMADGGICEWAPARQ